MTTPPDAQAPGSEPELLRNQALAVVDLLWRDGSMSTAEHALLRTALLSPPRPEPSEAGDPRAIGRR